MLKLGALSCWKQFRSIWLIFNKICIRSQALTRLLSGNCNHWKMSSVLLYVAHPALNRSVLNLMVSCILQTRFISKRLAAALDSLMARSLTKSIMVENGIVIPKWFYFIVRNKGYVTFVEFLIAKGQKILWRVSWRIFESNILTIF